MLKVFMSKVIIFASSWVRPNPKTFHWDFPAPRAHEPSNDIQQGDDKVQTGKTQHRRSVVENQKLLQFGWKSAKGIFDETLVIFGDETRGKRPHLPFPPPSTSIDRGVTATTTAPIAPCGTPPQKQTAETSPAADNNQQPNNQKQPTHNN